MKVGLISKQIYRTNVTSSAKEKWSSNIRYTIQGKSGSNEYVFGHFEEEEKDYTHHLFTCVN